MYACLPKCCALTCLGGCIPIVGGWVQPCRTGFGWKARQILMPGPPGWELGDELYPIAEKNIITETRQKERKSVEALYV